MQNFCHFYKSHSKLNYRFGFVPTDRILTATLTIRIKAIAEEVIYKKFSD